MTNSKDDIIIYVVKNKYDCNNSQLLSFKYGFGWGFKSKQITRNYFGYMFLVFRLSEKRISYINGIDKNILEESIGIFRKENIIEDLSKLELLLSGKKIINYNKPRILIYD